MHDALPGLRLHWQPGGLLDALFNADVAVFRAEMDLIFGCYWISGEQEPGLPGPGDGTAIRIGGAPILVLYGVGAWTRGNCAVSMSYTNRQKF